jgi:predicted transcriptional regulator
VEKTTLYLPADLKAALTRLARQRGVSEAEVIRESLRDTVARQRPRPRAGLYASGDPIAHRIDELLTGFGER